MKKIFNRIYYKCKSIISTKLPKYFIANAWLSSLYYFIFSSKFNRELHSVLVGKVKHLRDSESKRQNIYTLIRNTHRLEKGLLMKPRREIFAVDFIKETVDNFESFYDKNKCQVGSQIKWSYDVLSNYFEVTGAHNTIDTQRKRFINIVGEQDISTQFKSIPYYRHEINKPSITYEDFYKLTKYRRSVRWFLNKKVPHELIDKAILAANQAPSACNRQPFEYRVIDDPNLLQTVVNIPMGIRGYQHNVPMLIIAVGNLDAYFDERDRHVIYVDASLANMSLMFALETLGLSSCSINWPDIENLERKMENALKLKKHQRPIMCMAVGYPDPEGMVAYSEKRSLDDIRRFN